MIASCCSSGRRRRACTARLERLFGPPEPVDEVFGRHHVDEMLGLRRRLLGAPGRVADGAELLLGQEPFDLVWLTFCAAHVAGHQFWDLSQLDPDGLDARRDAVLEQHARRRLRRRSTAPSTASSPRSPTGADVMLVSPVGMDANTSRADLLPEMLRAILDPEARRRADDAIELDLATARVVAGGLRAQGRQRAARAAVPGSHVPARAARLRLDHDARLRSSRGEPGLRPTEPSWAANATASSHPKTRTG